MSTNRLTIQQLLTAEERATLDTFCVPGRGVALLPALAKFLHERLAVELVLDPDIVCGFSSDQSNLPGKAQALARPTTARECAIILRACHRAQLPLTLSGGRSNLTGSATPQGGVVLSTMRMLTPAPEVDVARKRIALTMRSGEVQASTPNGLAPARRDQRAPQRRQEPASGGLGGLGAKLAEAMKGR